MKLYDVAIIGCGPVGAVAAHLFTRQGLDVLVLEREATPYPLPRAVHLDHEMMRIFQSIGMDQILRKDMCDADGHLHIGADHGVIKYMGSVGQARPYGWSNDYFFYQPELEDHLRGGLSQYDNCDLRLGAELVALSQTDGIVTLDIKTKDETYQARSKWLVGCDGARSMVRKSLDIKLDDLDFEEPWLVVDAEVNGPISFPPLSGVPKQANLQRLSVMMCDPKRPATIVPGRGNHRRWEFMLHPHENDQVMMEPENVAKLVAPYLGDVDHEIVRAATYRFHGLIAEKWQEGNIFLAGDAAHQTPPFFGQGMCHGLRDVANLAWKFGLINKGISNDGILKSYQTERDPHVRSVISTAVNAGRYICMLDEDEAQARDLKMRETAKQSQTGTAAAIIPPILDGMIHISKAAGLRFIQPMLSGGENSILLDDKIGSGWRVFCKDQNTCENAKTAMTNHTKTIEIKAIDISTLNDDNVISNWLDTHNAKTVLVRPDFYVFGTDGENPDALFNALSHQLSLQP